jgi:hypothetical protein
LNWTTCLPPICNQHGASPAGEGAFGRPGLAVWGLERPLSDKIGIFFFHLKKEEEEEEEEMSRTP